MPSRLRAPLTLVTVSTGSVRRELPDAEIAPDLLDLSIAIREAFHNPVDLTSTDPRDQPLINRLFQRSGDSRSPQSGAKGHERDLEAFVSELARDGVRDAGTMTADQDGGCHGLVHSRREAATSPWGATMPFPPA